MGSRDIKQREQKKQKKDTKKAISIISLPTPSAEVPVVRKRKAREEAP